MIRRASLLGGIILVAWNPVHAQRSPCTDALAQQAEAQSGTQHNWDQLYSYYLRFGNCFGPKVEDADAEEGTSDVIEHLLASHWDTLPRLGQLIHNDPAFGQFIGLDATMDLGDIRKIKDNAQYRCPPGMHRFCQRLIETADEAIGEIKNPYWQPNPVNQPQ